jgi:diaminopimelate decarboxylase
MPDRIELNGPTPSVTSAPIGRHLLPLTAAVDDAGHLVVGGVDIVELAEEIGTPFLAYDEAHLRAVCREVVGAFGDGAAYATKAFHCAAMARLALEEGLSLDVSTLGELEVARAGGATGSRLVAHGNNKSVEELRAAVELGVGRVVLDSFDEIERLDRVWYEVAKRGSTDLEPVAVLVRVTPGVEAHTHAYVMTGQEDSKFGFGLASGAALAAIERIAGRASMQLVGLHAHIGSQILRVDAFRREVEALAPLLERAGLRELCIGGGLGVAYRNDEQAPSIAEWGATIRAACADAGVALDTRLTAEPGRVIVATAGMTCYRVGTIKELTGIRTYVAVDGGMSDNPRPQLYQARYEAFLPRAVAAERTRQVRVVGKHCESGDVVIDEAHVPADLGVGDLLGVPVTGAYTYAMASNYNRVPRPPVVFLADGVARVVLRRETIEDLLRLEPL